MSDFAKVDKRLWTGAFGRHLRGNSDAQALACYLLSGPQSNTLGLYRLPKGYALADLGWTEAKFDRALDHLLEFRKPHGSDIDMTSISLRCPFLLFHEASETVWIVGHAGHTYPSGMSKGSKRSRGIENDLKRIGENAFTPLFLGKYADLLGVDPTSLGYDFDITSMSYRYDIGMIPIDRDLDLERDLEEEGASGATVELQPKPDPTFPENPKLEATWQEWLVHRREKRNAVKPGTATWKSQVRDLKAMSTEDAVASIRQSIKNGWTGLFEPKGPWRAGGAETGNTNTRRHIEESPEERARKVAAIKAVGERRAAEREARENA